MKPRSHPKKVCLNKEFWAAAAAVVVVLLLLFLAAAQWLRYTPERWPFYAAEDEEEERGRVILLLVDRLTYSDLLCGAGPNLWQALKQGAVALMNVRSGRTGSESGYLSFGAAARAAAGPEGGAAFDGKELIEGEKAAVVFKRCTGNDPTGALFHLQAAALQERNSNLPYPVTVGLFGEILQQKGLTAAVWGNADGAAPNRSAVLVAMNRVGEVYAGAVGPDLLLDDPLYPYGMRTDIDKLAGVVAANISEADLHLVEFGDSSRLDEYWPQLSPSRGEALFKQTMENLDLLVGKFLSALNEKDFLILAVPSLPLNRMAGRDQLTPFILVAGDGLTPGLLGSASTRRPGLVQNTDLLAIVLALFGGCKDRSVNDFAPPFNITPQKNPPVFLRDFNRHSALVFEQRSLLLKPYIALFVLVLLVVLMATFLKIRAALEPASHLIGALLLVPPALLLLPGVLSFPLSTAVLSGLLLGGVVLLPALLMLRPPKGKSRFLCWAVLGWGTVFILLIDTLFGVPLQQLSLFSYDPIGGARYYGIGTEHMGVLIGAALLGTGSLTAFIAGSSLPGHDRPPKHVPLFLFLVILLLYGLIIFVFAAPNFGANLGGSLTAAVAFGVSSAGLFGAGKPLSTLKKRAAYYVPLFLVIAVGLLWLLNMCRSWFPPSHVGLFSETLRLHGLAGFRETVLRKLEMNLKLMRYSIWSRAFVTLVGLCLILSIFPGGHLKRLRRDQPDLVVGVGAALAGAAAALLTNDSGVVAAATLLLYTVPPALLMVMQKNFHQKRA